MGYTVGEVAQWSGVTVRTLHHYEHIALLSPAGRSSSGYRVYDDADLERLQQILFYRELGFSLDHIAAVLASPRDAVEHLAYQRGLVLDRIQNLQGLVAAIDQAMEAKTMGTTPTPAERFAALTEGKTKVILDAGDGTVLIRSKDDITASDGTRHDVIDGKAASSTTTTCNVFRMLDANGVPTHFVEQLDPVTFRARNVEMIPLELVARRIATGSFLDRHPDLADGTVLPDLVFEVFEKDDASHDPLIELDFAQDVLRRFVPNTKAAVQLGDDVTAGDLLREEPLSRSRHATLTSDLLEQLRELTLRTFEIVEHAWGALGGTYFDFKIECGFDRETGKLLVADVIDSDSGRLRFGDRDMSKQAYRDGSQSLPEIKKNFDEVAELTQQFV
jgi:phosphoribosylaminoimidazole-succinocarboxamide synthase